VRLPVGLINPFQASDQLAAGRADPWFLGRTIAIAVTVSLACAVAAYLVSQAGLVVLSRRDWRRSADGDA
jgi:hypothetical protein